jgi:hypothetical protein
MTVGHLGETMKKTTITFISFLLFFTVSGYCAEKSPEVKKLSNSWYSASIYSNSIYFFYEVDTKAQLCFISSQEKNPIPCSNLKKRPEWNDIITWE